MKKNICITLVTLLSFANTQSYPWNTQNLNPVHGLFVKPSNDGTTGDLYVAASEDSGIKSQWIADQTINFLPVASASQTHSTTVPLAYPLSPSLPPSDAPTQKRAVMASPMPSPPIQYAYAMPAPSSASTEGSPVAPYPYAFPVPFSTESSAPKCDGTANVGQYPFPYQYPYQFFYPHVMSAYANSMSILKDVGLSEDSASSVMANAAPMWPPASYAYPMYVMVDPNTWAKGQASSAPTSPAPSSSSTSQEST